MGTVGCEIEVLSGQGEEAWIISIDTQAVKKVSLLFAALHLACISKIVFQDHRHNRTFVIEKDSVALDKRCVSVGDQWIHALWRLLVDTELHGWTDTAHIDQDFAVHDGSVSITFSIKLCCCESEDHSSFIIPHS